MRPIDEPVQSNNVFAISNHERSNFVSKTKSLTASNYSFITVENILFMFRIWRFESFSSLCFLKKKLLMQLGNLRYVASVFHFKFSLFFISCLLLQPIWFETLWARFILCVVYLMCWLVCTGCVESFTQVFIFHLISHLAFIAIASLLCT